MSKLLAKEMTLISSGACLIDIIPPVFGGIVSATPTTNGHFLLAWLTATDATDPIDYVVYSAKGTLTAAELFLPENISAITRALSLKLFTYGETQQFFSEGDDYTFGVRAKDASNNVETNTLLITQTAISSGSAIDEFQAALIRLENIAPKFGQKITIKMNQQKTKVRFIQEPTIKVKLLCD